MENGKRFTPTRRMTGIVFGLVLLILTAPVGAFALTSGNTTIHNWVSVTYTSGSFTPPAATSFIDVTVATVAAAATITTPAGKTVAPGAFVTYSSAITSNASGLDTYNLGPANPTTPTSGIVGSPATTFNYGGVGVASISLWGGITSAASALGSTTITFPGGALTGSGLAAGSKLVIGVNTYTIAVGGVSPGSANTNVGGLSNEAPGTITLTSGLIVGIASGTQVGELKKFDYQFTAGNPQNAGVDGLYNTVVTATSTFTNLLGVVQAVSTTGTTTRVESPLLTITKSFRVLPAGSPITTGPINTALYTTNTAANPAKPGQIIEYLITILNSNAAVASAASSVNVTDPVVTPYTTYVQGSTYWGNGSYVITQIDNLVASKLVTGYTFTNPIAGGNVQPAAAAYIVYQVTVQ